MYAENQQLIAIYWTKFKNVRRGSGKEGAGKAPHKPVLLITLIEAIDKGLTQNNKFIVTPELVALFKENFLILYPFNNYNPDFFQPFHYLKNDGFWHLSLLYGKELSGGAIKSFQTLQEVVAYAYMDTELWKILQIKEVRVLLIDHIISYFFSENKKKYYHIKNNKYGFSQDSENFVLNEPSPQYMITGDAEEVQFVRGGFFKRLVPRIYDNACCISGLKIMSSENISMIDACHVKPFSNSNDDRVSNGIALTPTLHRAFDRGLITINEQYKVVCSPQFIENNNSLYSIKQFHGKRISLPIEKHHFPSIDNLIWHSENIYLK